MWAGLGLTLALCLLPGGGAESQGPSARCKEAPDWRIGEENPMLESRGLGGLQLKLENKGFVNVSFVVINHHEYQSRQKYHQLREKISANIPIYQQEETQPDVWTALNGKKDDFLIYDRCGRLVHHLGLPYSFLSFPYVEKAIQDTYCGSTCGNCSYMTPELEELCNNLRKAAEVPTVAAPSLPEHHRHPHRHGENRNRHGTGHGRRHQFPQTHQQDHRISVVQAHSLEIGEASPQQAVVAVPQGVRL